MKKALVLAAGAALLALSGQIFAASNEVSEDIWIGGKIYDRTFGRGCGTCHDVKPNPDLFESVKKLSKDEFIGVLKNGRNGMPKAGAAIMQVGPVKKAGYTEDQAMDAVYAYIKGRSDGSIPAGKLKKAK
jgi:mono/diheme cytochrome c family protein